MSLTLTLMLDVPVCPMEAKGLNCGNIFEMPLSTYNQKEIWIESKLDVCFGVFLVHLDLKFS